MRCPTRAEARQQAGLAHPASYSMQGPQRLCRSVATQLLPHAAAAHAATGCIGQPARRSGTAAVRRCCCSSCCCFRPARLPLGYPSSLPLAVGLQDSIRQSRFLLAHRLPEGLPVHLLVKEVSRSQVVLRILCSRVGRTMESGAGALHARAAPTACASSWASCCREHVRHLPAPTRIGHAMPSADGERAGVPTAHTPGAATSLQHSTYPSCRGHAGSPARAGTQPPPPSTAGRQLEGTLLTRTAGGPPLCVARRVTAPPPETQE